MPKVSTDGARGCPGKAPGKHLTCEAVVKPQGEDNGLRNHNLECHGQDEQTLLHDANASRGDLLCDVVAVLSSNGLGDHETRERSGGGEEWKMSTEKAGIGRREEFRTRGVMTIR